MQLRQDHMNQSLGNCVHFAQQGQHLHFTTDWAKLIVTIYRSDIVRIRAIEKDRPFEDFSYAVIREPEPTKFSLNQHEEGWEISTDSLQLHIQKAPLRFSLRDVQGNEINSDDAAFGISKIGHEWYNYKTLREDEKFIGLGEKTGYLNRRGKWYQHWNTDAFAYGEEDDPLYMSTPYYLGLTSGSVYGVFLDNTYRSIFNFGASNHRFSYFQVPDGELNYYLIHNQGVAENVQAYCWLTGTPALPPKWSLGYQQCRYSYYPDTEVLNIARTFREKQVPCDVIYLDIHYMDAYKLFTWNEKAFPDPATFIQALQEMNFRVVVIIDPGVKVEADYPAYESGKLSDLFVKYPDGTYYSGDVWPGTCHFPDFTKTEAREWWGKQFAAMTEMGISGFWNDMNEPVTWGKKLPDLIEFDFDGKGATHRKAHNVYGMQMARATAEGVRKLLPNERAFVLSRAGYSGSQRYAASWTGDNSASDDHMLLGVRLLINMGLAGLSFTGVDIGGFVGEANPKLFMRWMQIGTFSPMFRGHTMINSRDSEPWSYGEEAEEISRNFIRLRYRMMPYLYSLFYESASNGMPVVRSMVFYHPFCNEVYQRDWGHQYYFGPSLLVAAINSWQPIHKVWLPEGNWYQLYNGQKYAGNQIIHLETPVEILPVFVKSGSIIPMHLPGQHIDEIASDTLDLHLFAGDSACEFCWYDDDGSTYAYENGNYLARELRHLCGEQRLIIEPQTGTFQSKYKKLRIYLHNIASKEVFVNEQRLTVLFDTIRFVEPVSNFDPFFTPADHPWEHRNLGFVEFDYNPNTIEIAY